MAIRLNDHGQYEVFSGDEMIARVRTIEEAQHEETRRIEKIMGEISELKKREGHMEIERPINKLGFSAAFYDKRDQDRTIDRRIQDLELKLKISEQEREHASDLIVEVVKALKDGKNVLIQDRYGDHVIATEVSA